MTNKLNPTSLIRQEQIKPKTTASDIVTPKNENNKPTKILKKVKEKQTDNVKISRQTNIELKTLMELTGNKFSYEMIQSLIDAYVNNIIDADTKRAFNTLVKLKSDNLN